MQIITEQSYQILLTHVPVSETEERLPWQATLLGLPFIVEEALSRAQVIQQIKERIADLTTHAEIVTLYAPAISIESSSESGSLDALGWDDHGLFKDQSDALQLFDDIEKDRNNQMIGNP